MEVDNIMISFVETTGKLRIYFKSENAYRVKSTNYEVPIGEWAHVSVTYKNEKFQLFVNSSLKLDFTPDSPVANLNSERRSNFIGTNNWNHSPIDCIIDELKIFDRALTNEELLSEMNLNQPFNILYL